MSSSVIVIGASGYIGLGVAKGLRRAGYRVYGLIRNEKYSVTLIQNEIEPIVTKSFDNVQSFANVLASCSTIINAVGFTPELSPALLEAGLQAGKTRTEDGKITHYASLFIFTSVIMTCE
jgi:NAD(P)-dependent dehydrogenase (short-subunit alcohol dehydrogenase family)